MSEIKINYGNWVPRNLMFSFGAIEVIIIIISFVIPLFLVQLILWIISIILLLPIVFFYCLRHQFSKNNNEFQHKCWQLVLDKLNWDGNGKALDIGTGAGSLAIGLAKQYPSSTIYGVDYWGKLWEYSQQLCEKNANYEGVSERITFQKASASKMPFKNEEFDVIVSNFVFHEVMDVRKGIDVFKEAFRVLKKGGVFSIQDLLINSRRFGKIEDLLNTIKNWGIQELNFIKTIDEINMPKLVKIEMSRAGLLYGIK